MSSHRRLWQAACERRVGWPPRCMTAGLSWLASKVLGPDWPALHGPHPCTPEAACRPRRCPFPPFEPNAITMPGPAPPKKHTQTDTHTHPGPTPPCPECTRAPPPRCSSTCSRRPAAAGAGRSCPGPTGRRRCIWVGGWGGVARGGPGGRPAGGRRRALPALVAEAANNCRAQLQGALVSMRPGDQQNSNTRLSGESQQWRGGGGCQRPRPGTCSKRGLSKRASRWRHAKPPQACLDVSSEE